MPIYKPNEKENETEREREERERVRKRERERERDREKERETGMCGACVISFATNLVWPAMKLRIGKYGCHPK